MPKMMALCLIIALVGFYSIEATPDCLTVTAEGADAVIVTYAVSDSYYSCYGTPAFLPTTGNYETDLSWELDEGEAEAGDWLCVHLKTQFGHEETKAVKVEPVYHTFIPMAVRYR